MWRALAGLLVGLLLFLLGVPVLQSLVEQFGYYSDFTYEQAVLGFMLILLCIIAAQVTALRPPPEKK